MCFFNNQTLCFPGLDKVRRGSYGLILDVPAANYYANEETTCNLITSTSWATGKHYDFATQRNSAILASIDNVITRMKENKASWDRIINGVRSTRCDTGGHNSTIHNGM